VRRPNILIGIPSPHGREVPITRSLVYIAMSQARLADVSWWNHEGYQVDAARTRMAEFALEKGHTHILFLDDDIVPPPFTVDRMVNWHYPVITGAYERRTGGLASGMFINDETMEWKPLSWPLPEGEIGLVTASGMGCMMVDTRIFTRLSTPWFYYSKDGSEDMYFCRKVGRELGIQIMLDPIIECGHELTKVIKPSVTASDIPADKITAEVTP